MLLYLYGRSHYRKNRARFSAEFTCLLALVEVYGAGCWAALSADDEGA